MTVMRFGAWTAMPRSLPDGVRTDLLHRFVKEKAEFQAGIIAPSQKVAKVVITTIEDLGELIDDSGIVSEHHAMWMVEADVYLEESDDGAQV